MIYPVLCGAFFRAAARLCLVAIILSIGPEPGYAQPQAPSAEDLGDLSVEQLLQLKVTSVARREESVSDSPAAVFVLTGEAIHRSGATSIAEALRLVPGMDVARVDSHTWAISARGFNDVFANKLLVMIDGRTVYTPLFSGVYWDVQDVVMEDIDRIEVIRGPGASLWGANAVNGVINVITKKASETKGLFASFGGGLEERGFATIRFGGDLGQHAAYRVWGKIFRYDESEMLGGSSHDAWKLGHGGFRIDANPTEKDALTLQGEIYAGNVDQTYYRLKDDENFTPFVERTSPGVGGGYGLGRWTHTFTKTSEFTLQTYYDRTERRTPIFSERRDTFDIDFQHRFALTEAQTVIWGAGYRRTTDRARNSFDTSLDPDELSTELYSAFIQDEIALVKDKFVLTLGSKFEHNDYTGFEVQPSARLLWKVSPHQSAWASVSRAVRTPSRAEADIRLNQPPVIPRGALFAGIPAFGIPPSPAVVTSIFGSDDFGSENVIAYEAGYRVQPHETLSLDVALFYNKYEDLRSVELSSAPPDFTAVPPAIALTADNNLEAEAYGGEISVTWQAAKWLRLQANYSLLKIDAHRVRGSTDMNSELFAEGSSPQQQVGLHAAMDLTRSVTFDTMLRWVDELPALKVDPYFALDLRLAWHVSPHVEVAVVGRNVLDSAHAEFRPTNILTDTTEIESSVFGVVTINF